MSPVTSEATLESIRKTADEVFGWAQLREGLSEAVEGLLAGRDVLAIMPTGYGKSAIYKVAGALLPGVTVIVSPLIALQDDQVAGIRARTSAAAAFAVNSAQRDSANDEAWAELAAGRAEYLFLSPEQLTRDDVIERLAAANVSLFVVDEAHCVSSWGHDFRPDYLRLREAIDAVGRPVVLAMTATGSGPVRDEIIERLGLRDHLFLSRGYDRSNIRLEVQRHVEEHEKRNAVLEQIGELPKPGLLYVATHADTESYAELLAELGLRTAAYHGGLGAARRRELHEQFRDDAFDVVVATSAFGMGIDKAGIRFVLHATTPESIDEYYQEVGRSGRDGAPAIARLHYRPEDLALRKFFAGGGPDEGRLTRVFAALRSAARPVSVAQLAEVTQLSVRQLRSSLNLLIDAEVVTENTEGLAAMSTLEVADAVAAAVAVAEQREAIDESRIAMMRSYAETRGCRRIFLLGYFGEQRLEPCGNCDTCSSGTAFEEHPEATTDDVPYPLDSTVRHREWGEGTVMKVEDDRITVFFESEGYRVLSLDLVGESRLLERVD
jgi:ATP-dependent DNA helicase RecQ